MSKITDRYIEPLSRLLGAPTQESGALVAGGAVLERDAGFGGVVASFERGNIYYHWNADASAHELHGSILRAYLALGGHGVSESAGDRRFGFPVTDQRTTSDGLYEFNHFEWGAIYRPNDGGGPGPSSVSLEAWRWLRKTMAVGDEPALGYPSGDTLFMDRGRVSFFQRGLFWAADADTRLAVKLVAPMIGRPAITTPDGGGLADWCLRLDQADGSISAWPRAGFASFLDLVTWAVGDRFFLRPVCAPGVVLPDIPLVPTAWNPEVEMFRPSCKLAPSPGVRLAERTLYSLCLRRSDSQDEVLAPHALYVRSTWAEFGLIHATDIHVSRRLEGFRAKLAATVLPRDYLPYKLSDYPIGYQVPGQLTEEDAAKIDWPNRLDAYNCFNDRLRELVAFANRLHDLGLVDGIIATGDLVDYQYEEGDAREGPGNFQLLVDILRGLAPSSDSRVPVEALRVPIFTIPGNHDYRANEYRLHMRAHPSNDVVQVAASFFGAGFTAREYKCHNLTMAEAWVVDGQRHDVNGHEAARMVDVDPHCGPYRRYVNNELSYTVNLGPHRLVMLDTGPDSGVVTGFYEAIWVKIAGDEVKDEFMQGNPKSRGPLDGNNDLWMLASALQDAKKGGGLTLIGCHAPPVNVAGNEFNHYFRETERASGALDEVAGFLRRVDIDSFRASTDSALALVQGIRVHPTWLGDESTRGSAFAVGSGEDLVDYGGWNSSGPEFLDLIVGRGWWNGTGKGVKADLVLCGHGHYHTETRIDTRGETGFRFFMDHYSENPAVYYNSRHLDVDTSTTKVQWAYQLDDSHSVYIKVGKVQGPQAWHHNITEPGFEDYHTYTTPPYADPLNSSVDPRAWWDKRRPLILQTAGTGPMEARQRVIRLDDGQDTTPSKLKPTFQGVRFIRVVDNVIKRIHHVSAAQIKDKGYSGPWMLELPTIVAPTLSNLIGGVVTAATAPALESPVASRPAIFSARERAELRARARVTALGLPGDLVALYGAGSGASWTDLSGQQASAVHYGGAVTDGVVRNAVGAAGFRVPALLQDSDCPEGWTLAWRALDQDAGVDGDTIYVHVVGSRELYVHFRTSTNVVGLPPAFVQAVITSSDAEANCFAEVARADAGRVWRCWSVVCERATGRLSLWIDGKKVASDASPKLSSPGMDGEIRVLSRFVGDPALADLAIWRRPLLTAELESLAQVLASRGAAR